MVSRRQCAVLAARRIRSQLGSDEETPGHRENEAVKASATATPTRSVSRRKADALSSSHDASFPPAHASKRLKTDRRPAVKLKNIPKLQERLFDASYASCGTETGTETDARGCQFPLRQHSLCYHRPLLLQGPTGKQGRAALLTWFDSVSTRRHMPWRKDWINPKDHDDAAELRRALSVRAYEVWISEIMLQQTRVSVVIDYWTRWMTKWPTIEKLAAAAEDEVTSAWRGLGYYSRSKRIHEAAKMVVHDPNWRGLLPQDAGELQAKIPGIGRYTAGAITSIVFGKAKSMVQVISNTSSRRLLTARCVDRDGNVLRVLSRQLGLLGNVKSDKVVIDLLWAAADALVEAVVLETPGVDEAGELRPSDRPGRWGQALMELGSTICTPSPDCTACPISSTCRAHQEGRVLAAMQGSCRGPVSNATGPVEIEDVCGICEPFEDIADDFSAGHEATTSKAPARGRKQATESPFFTSRTSSGPGEKEPNWPESDSPQVAKVVASHAKRFPLKVAKKAVREQETIVCAVRRNSDGRYLIQKRPEKGKPASRIVEPTVFH